MAITVPTTDAAAFLRALGGESHTFQTYPDRKENGARALNRMLHGSIAQHGARLAELNAKGAAVCVMVSEGDGRGRKAENVRAVRAVFVDLDGAPLQPVETGPLLPHIVVESSPGRFHAYWRIADCPPSDFGRLQRALAARFDADPKVCDLPRAMRVPGFLHSKGEPFVSQLLTVREAPPFTYAELLDAFGIDSLPPAPAKLRLPDRIAQGARNSTLFQLASGAHRQGIPEGEEVARLQIVNAQRCDPPLSTDEVRAIVANAYRRPVSGHLAIPYAVTDSEAFKALDSEAVRVLLLAYRRFNGSNDGEITLTWSECAEAFPKGEKAFERARRRAVASGLLAVACEHTPPSKGRRPRPALYRLPAVIGSTRDPYQRAA